MLFSFWHKKETGMENVDPVAADTIVQSDFVERVADLASLKNIVSPATNNPAMVVSPQLLILIPPIM